jgi:hypothetical protein
MARHPIYEVWKRMRQRCNNPNDIGYHLYGGRGITVCARWDSFEAFCDDMLVTWQPGLLLDRVDNALGYFPENCRWTTPKISSRNKRNNHIIDTEWGSITLTEAAERLGMSSSTLRQRIKRGWAPSRLFAPLERQARTLRQPQRPPA